jgi:signal peptidase I
MKKDKLIEYIFSISLCIILFFNLFVLNIFNNKYVFAIFLLIYLVVVLKFIKPKKADSINKKKVILFMTIFAILYIIFLYIVGIFVGFYENPVGFNLKGIYKWILPLSAIIVATELIRNLFLTRENKKATFIATIGLILIEVSTYIDLYTTLKLDTILALIGYVILHSISVNLLCNYIVRKYGYIPNIVYRIITSIYIYILPIIPDIYLFFQSVFRIIYPYIIYLVIDYAFTTDNFKLALKNKKTNIISLLISIILVFSIVLLVSCKFRYGIMVVGSSSMTGSINKGDAVIFEQYRGQELEEGQVIIFYKDNIQTIHRIEDIQLLNGETIYYTKGDNNQQKDDGYRIEQDIIGIVKFKLIYIGWPTIWVKQIFST